MTIETLAAPSGGPRTSLARRYGDTLRYIARRIGHAAIVVWAAYTITFVLLYLLPSDPITIMLQSRGDGTGIDPVVLARLNAQYGFDEPVIWQYLTLLLNALQGDFGNSINDGRPVLTRILEVLPYTIELSLAGLAVGIVLGIGVAVFANLTRRSWVKHILFSYAPFVASVPAFLIGLFLIQVFSYNLGLLPAAGNKGFVSLILPALAIGLQISDSIAQVTAKSIHENLHAPYAHYLRAKGLSRRAILLHHSLRNAIIPAVTLVGLSIGSILGGAIITETVFSRQGLGRLLEEAVTHQDIPVVQAVVVFTAILFAISNLAVDLIYPLINPKVTVR
ncbi:MAG: ABC transporter permease [Pseudochelatococcus sp.]|jgi:peptide/nickel transport system permease protein|uniref:ABC transporter permease n=1 Tax=Pseudochelatococcus sp. TaxID=2020869 RepID=UPI003D8D6399